MERVRNFFKQVKTSNGRVVDVVNMGITYNPSMDPANPNPVSIPLILGKHPHYIVETEEGTESFPKINSEFEKGEEVLIVETCYCRLPVGRELKKKPCK